MFPKAQAKNAICYIIRKTASCISHLHAHFWYDCTRDVDFIIGDISRYCSTGTAIILNGEKAFISAVGRWTRMTSICTVNRGVRAR